MHTENPTDTQSPSQVALIRCSDYAQDNVTAAVGRGLALLGGVERFVRRGERLLLKPNLLVASDPEKAVTTHPAVFRAVAQQLQAAGAVLTYGDSPAFELLPGGAARGSGLGEVAHELGIPLADFVRGRTVSFPEGGLIKRFALAEGVLSADGLVSLPKFKTHGLTRVTGAVKNQFGCVPGLLKSQFHAQLADQERFCQMLVDLNRLLRPRLVVMDGIVAMEGNGPRGGDPRHLGVLMLSADPVALDSTACEMINLAPELVPTITWGQRWGLGQYQNIQFVGDAIESFRSPDFVVNRARGSTTGRPGLMSRFMREWVVPRPALISERCVRCGLCARMCPVEPKAIDFRDPGGPDCPPAYDYHLCIRCYCCQELCPEKAIVVQERPLGRLFGRHPG